MATMTAQAIAGPEAWRGEELARSTDWIREIPPAVLWGSIEAGALRSGIAQPATTQTGGTS